MAEYIEREALISKIVNTPFVVRCSGETDDYKNGVLDGLVKKQHNVIDMIQKQPAADVVEVKHASWEWGIQCGQEGVYCTNCGSGWTKAKECELIASAHYFCPKCGAKMNSDNLLKGGWTT